MYVLMWSVVLPPENNPVLDDHILGALSMVVLAAYYAGDTWGLGKVWAPTSASRTTPSSGVAMTTPRPPDGSAPGGSSVRPQSGSLCPVASRPSTLSAADAANESGSVNTALQPIPPAAGQTSTQARSRSCRCACRRAGRGHRRSLPGHPPRP